MKEQYYTSLYPVPTLLMMSSCLDGDYLINMSPDEYKVFQDNQSAAPLQAAPEAAPEAPSDDSISVTQDAGL